VATYYVYSGAGGSNTGADWANAFVALGSAISAATANGDVVKVHYTHQENLTVVSTTYTLVANISVISVNKDSSDVPTPMGTGGWIGDATTNQRSITVTGAYAARLYGITFRVPAASLTTGLVLYGANGSDFTYEDCYFWCDMIASWASTRYIVVGASDIKSNIRFDGCTFRFNDSRAAISLSTNATFYGCILSSAGTAPSTLFKFSVQDPSNSLFFMDGCDWSHLGSNALVDDVQSMTLHLVLQRCKLGTGYTILAPQTTIPNNAGAHAFLSDCAVGDTHGVVGYYSNMGSLVSDTGTFFTAGAAQQAWKISTTSQASLNAPFLSPWIDIYNTDTATVTPYLECLRNDGTASVRQDNEVWAQFSAKVTSGTVLSTRYSDRMVPAGTPANQAAGAGTGSWTIASSNSPASFKCDSGASLTPAEVGYIRGRICVGAPSITIYVDPQIRT